MKRLLITGGNGLLGNRVKYFAEKSGEFDVLSPSSKECDLLDGEARKCLIDTTNPEYLIHLAWNQSKGFRNSKNNYNWAEASLDLMKLFRENGGKRFLFAGSSSEYDAENGIFSENEGRAQTIYGSAKRMVTEEIAKCGCGVSARYFTIYGKNDRHDFAAIPSAIDALLKNEKIICHSPKTVRDYIYADDAAKATIKLLNSDLKGIVNIASGEKQTMYKVFTLIADIMNKRKLVSFGNEPTGMLLADVSKMKNELCYSPETAFEDGIRETITERRFRLGL